MRQSLKVRPSYAVPGTPVMVASHLKRLSPSGKAEIPVTPDICDIRYKKGKKIRTVTEQTTGVFLVFFFDSP